MACDSSWYGKAPPMGWNLTPPSALADTVRCAEVGAVDSAGVGHGG